MSHSDQSNVSNLKHSSRFITKLKWRYNDVFNFWGISLCTRQNMQEKATLSQEKVTQWIDLENDDNSSLSLKPSNLELLINQFNNATPENNNDPEEIC